MGCRSWATKRVQREPQCDLVVVRPTRCFPAQRGWEQGKHASARTWRIPWSPGHTQSRFINDWVCFTRSKFGLSSVAISSPIFRTQHVPNSQSLGSIRITGTRTRNSSAWLICQIPRWALVWTERVSKGFCSHWWRNRQTFCLRKRQSDYQLNKSSHFFRMTVPEMICGSGWHCFWNDPRVSPEDDPLNESRTVVMNCLITEVTGEWGNLKCRLFADPRNCCAHDPPNSLAFRTGCSQSVVMHTYT